MENIVITYTDRLTKNTATASIMPPCSMEKFREDKEWWKKHIMRGVENAFKDRIERELQAYFGEIDVRITIGDVSLCKATLTTNVFAGRVDAEYRFNKIFD